MAPTKQSAKRSTGGSAPPRQLRARKTMPSLAALAMDTDSDGNSDDEPLANASSELVSILVSLCHSPQAIERRKTLEDTGAAGPRGERNDVRPNPDPHLLYTKICFVGLFDVRKWGTARLVRQLFPQRLLGQLYPLAGYFHAGCLQGT